MKKIIILLTLLISTYTHAADPILFFSDITSGPDTGLGDGLGSGAIVTIWGQNIGSSQGTSTVYFKDSAATSRDAAHVYGWADATQHAGHPADLYSYHKMQAVSFSIPDSAAGAGAMYVTVGGVSSNELPFTVRSGNIRYIKTTGNNSTGDGSWANPWATVDYLDSPAGAASKTSLVAGDIIYACDGITENITRIRDKTGTSGNPFALIAYPGATYTITSSGDALVNYYPYNSDYWVFSKIKVVAEVTGITAFKGMRVVGCEITDISSADGQSGAISGAGAQAGGGIKCLGNYVHDFGGQTTTSLHHVFYLSNRSGSPIEAYELGWNYLKDNEARHGLHIYDESACGDYTGTFKVHDNVVVNQRGAAFHSSAPGTNCITAPMEVYNNLFINCGLSPWQNSTIYLMMSGLTSHIKFYNNTIYGYGESTGGDAVHVQANGSASWNFGGTFEWVNNIVVDTKNQPYQDPVYYQVPTVHHHNLWYSGGDSTPANPPSWDTLPIATNPQFTNAGGGDFSLLTGSPAIDAGSSDVSSVVKTDLLGVSYFGGIYEIGAIGSGTGGGTPQDPPPIDPGGGVCSGGGAGMINGSGSGIMITQ